MPRDRETQARIEFSGLAAAIKYPGETPARRNTYVREARIQSRTQAVAAPDYAFALLQSRYLLARIDQQRQRRHQQDQVRFALARRLAGKRQGLEGQTDGR